MSSDGSGSVLDAEVTVDGVSPGRVDWPESTQQLSELLADTAQSHPAVVVCGAATKLGVGGIPESVDLLIRTRRMHRIVEHAAGDLVVTVEPGLPLADLQEELAASGQMLALDPPEPGATIGGIVAAAASGPRRFRWGTPRDLLIGVTVVLADGTIAKSGGKVVKNVAGYDLGKLFTGSFGSLGVIAECTFRLHPRPRAPRWVTLDTDDPAAAVSVVRRSGTEPSAIEWDGRTLTVLVEGSDAVAAAQARTLADRLGATIARQMPAGFGQRPWQPGQVGLKFTHRLGGLRTGQQAIARVLPSARVAAHAGSGVLWVGAESSDAVVAAVAELRREAAALDGQVVVVEAPAATKRELDVWGPARGIDVMRRVKDQFDPDRRMTPGRFVGGL